MDIKFFENFKVSVDKKIGITNLLSNITTREGSHKGGWARLLKCQLENLGYYVKVLANGDSLSNYDVIVFDLGAEYSGSLNLFGGLDEKVYGRLKEIRDFKGQLFSWRSGPPSLIEGLKSRQSNASTCSGFKSEATNFLDEVQKNMSRVETFDHVHSTNALLIGDSHTPSVWSPEWMIERQDGRTLYGALQSGVISTLVEKYSPKHVMIHMSSIDVRHHLARQENPEQSTVQLVTALVNQVLPLSSFHSVKTVTICETMGIEDESRDLPKTGFYKGTPFYGDWATRNRIRDIFNAMLEECKSITGWTVQKYPSQFFDETGKLKFDVMERPQSVHLSPEYYFWDLDQNKRRWEK